MKKLKDEEEISKNCTFHPRVIGQNLKNIEVSSHKLLEEPKDKCLKLFELSKCPKTRKNTENIETTNLIKHSNNSKKLKEGPIPKSYRNTIQRMLTARENREFIEELKKKGNTTT